MKMNKNGKKIILSLAIILIVVLSCVILNACNVDDVKEISVTPDTINVRIGEFEYSDYTVTATYGSGKTEQFKLTADMIEAKDRVKLFLEGEHEITVSYQNQTTTLKVNVRRNVFEGVEFNDLDVVYTGEYYTVEVKNVPEGTTVTYPSTNRFRNAGQYQATAILRKDAFEMKVLTANINIRKADYDLSKVTFEDKTEAYNGEIHSLALDGELPIGLYVDYTITKFGGREEAGNSAKNAGIYTVQATFSGDSTNYNIVEPKQAQLKIEQAVIDMSAVKFDSKTTTYDRTMQKIEIEGTLPVGVSVRYIDNEHVDAGVYAARAIFSIDDIINYAPIEDMRANLTILKADYDMSGVQFNGTKVMYDGKEKKIEIEGQLPMGLSVSYDNNVGIDADSYLATAIFENNNPNYNDPQDMTATLIIDPAPAPMDRISFERRRFISRRDPKDRWSEFEFERAMSELEALSTDPNPDLDKYLMLEQYFFDPYLAANEYRPANIPSGLEVSSVKYLKVDGWVDDLAEYDGIDKPNADPSKAIIYKDKITEDGYYVVIVNFDAGANYTGVIPVKTLLRADTMEDFSSWEMFIYDKDWVNPDTGEVSGAFMDYYKGACIVELKKVEVGDMTVDYCDCNVFRNYVDGDQSALLCKYDDCYIPESKMEAYDALAAEYYDFWHNIDRGNIVGGKTVYTAGYTSQGSLVGIDVYRAFLAATEDASQPLTDDMPASQFDLDSAAFVGISEGEDYVITNRTGDETLDDYRLMLANIFGFETIDDFCAEDGAVGMLKSEYFDSAFQSMAGVSMDSVKNQLACAGAIYVETNFIKVYIMPYSISWVDEEDGWRMNTFYVFICEELQNHVKFVGALLDDANSFFELINTNTQEKTVIIEGRCTVSEISLYRLNPVTKIVIDEYGNEEKRVITSGKDFIFIEESDATNHLIHESRETYKFTSDLTGTCAEESEGYQESDYIITTNRAKFEFCDCDPFASLMKTGGVASEITKRKDRDDHAQISTEFADAFDVVSALYDDFISRILSDEDVDTEWKIGVTNNKYASYKAYFEYAQYLMYWAGRNLGKNNDYVVSESVIVGINRGFVVTINGNGNDYNIDQYRKIVSNLFGYTDVSTFIAHASALASELQKNAYYASADSLSARLIYDGAVYTANGYFVLPFVIHSELTKQKVLALMFVDTDGNMSVWINDARNAFNATNFGNGEEVLADGDKYEVTIYGRCLICEDDGYTMKEDLDSKVNDMITNLQNFANNMFVNRDIPQNCAETNYDEYEDYEYLIHTDAETYGYYAYYDFCDCDPFARAIKTNGESGATTRRVDRDDHISILPEVAADFDTLTALYKAFFSNYVIADDGVNDWRFSANEAHYFEYRRFFKQARGLFDRANNNLGNTAEYILTDSALIGMNKSFAFSGSGNNYTVMEYRQLVAKLLGFVNVDALNLYTQKVAEALVANEKGASTSTDESRLLYDGAVYTENGVFVLPYSIKRDTLENNVLAFIFVDTDGTTSIWINDVENAFEAVDFEKCGPETRGGIYINGRCALFENEDYTGFRFSNKDVYAAIEKTKSFAEEGDYLIYSPFSDDEGFAVYWFALYDYELEVIYEEDASEGVGTVHQNCYTFVNVVSVDDIHEANLAAIEEYKENGGEEEWN